MLFKLYNRFIKLQLLNKDNQFIQLKSYSKITTNIHILVQEIKLKKLQYSFTKKKISAYWKKIITNYFKAVLKYSFLLKFFGANKLK